jgi:CheY-like chemotaxis protein
MTRPLEILLIEDNDGDAFLISELLRDVGVPMNITIASDGQIALDILNKDKGHSTASTPDFVVLDLNLPNVNGFDVLRRIRTSPSLRTLPVVVMTGSLNPEDEALARSIGVADYRIKPAHSDEFESLIRWFKENLGRLAERKREGTSRTRSDQENG